MASTIITGGLGGAIGSDAIAPDRIVLTEFSGRLTAIEPSTGTLTPLGSGWTEPVGVAVARGGSTLCVTERGGDVLEVGVGAADRSDATRLAGGLAAPHGIVLAPDGASLLLVEFGAPGRLLRLGLDGTLDVLLAGLEGAVGVALDALGEVAFVSEQAPGGGRVTRVELATGSRQVLATGLHAPFLLAWADAARSALLVPERDPANRIRVVDAVSGAVRTVSTVGARPSSALRLGDQVVVCCDATLEGVDVSGGLLAEVRLDVPGHALFPGSYARVPVDFGATGLTLDDLTFAVPEGPLAGSLSPSRDASFDPAAPEVMLLAGSEAGGFTLEAIETATGSVVGAARFAVSADWHDEAQGPGLAFVGESALFVTGSAWGGGPDAVQNVNVHPAAGTRRVAVVLVDTPAARHPTTGAALQAIRDEWAGELVGGAADPDGVVRSVRRYFQEVSHDRFDVELVGGGVLGPVQLGGDWTTYFVADANGSWAPTGAYLQACVTGSQGLLDFDGVDSLVVVMASVQATATDPMRFAWPYAGGGTFTYTRPGATRPTQRGFATVSMPVDWEAIDGRRTHETLAHELGHNVGLPDLYMSPASFGAATAARELGEYDLMSADDPLPHLSVANRLMLGWVDAGWIQRFDFANSGAVDQTVTLHAMEALTQSGPPAGRLAGIEVRRADLWNYYFEYRAGQVSDIGDRQLTEDRRVLGTDVVSDGFSAPVTRRQILRLADDGDGQGAALAPGEDYEERDESTEGFPADFLVEVLSATQDEAQVRIRYGANNRPDPSLRPWPGGTIWQSPDIEVRNARSDADAAWANTPWANNPNRVVAKVTNRGNIAAPGVRVNFFVKDFTIGSAPEFPLGSDTHTIPAGATVEFAAEWIPPAEGHFCIVARIPLYQDPGNPAVIELTQLNNEAQSNYDRFVSGSGSPSTREVSSIAVTNPYPERTRVFVVVQQSAATSRTYLEHQWLWLDPGETRAVQVMFESLLGDPVLEPQLELVRERVWRKPTQVSLVGLVEDPRDEQLHATQVMGGAQVEVAAGRRTRFDEFAVDDDVAHGHLSTVDDGTPVDAGTVLVAVRSREGGEVVGYARAKVRDGFFRVALELRDHPEAVAQGHYLGAFGLAPCDSETVPVRA